MRVIFDLDGTLFQTASCVTAAVRALAETLGEVPPQEAEISARIGLRTAEFLAALFPGREVDALLCGQFQDLERAQVAQCGALFKGGEELLQTLSKEGHRLFLCSSGSLEYQELVLRTMGIRSHFEGLRSAACGRTKAQLLQELGQVEPAVYVGDTRQDLEAARQSGMPFIGALYGYGTPEPSFRAQRPGEILALVRQIEVFQEITDRLVGSGRRILGISGVDTSGKTWFADHYAAFLRTVGYSCEVVHLDDYHNPSEVRARGEDEVDAYYQNAYDLDRLTREVLMPLRETGCLERTVKCLDLDTDQYTREVSYRAERETVVLVEGVLLFRPPVDEYLDARIFLDVSFEEVLRRAAVRDAPKYGEKFLDRYRRKYIPVQRRYLEEWRPGERCDLLIQNEDYRAPILTPRARA